MEKIIISLLIIILLSLIGVAGDFFIKLSGNGQKFIEPKLFLLGMLIYALTAFGWFFVMKNVKLSTLGVIYAISTAIFLTLVGIFYFREKLNHYEIVGIITGLISIILLGKFR
jgi:small multidrug resistance pump